MSPSASSRRRGVSPIACSRRRYGWKGHPREGDGTALPSAPPPASPLVAGRAAMFTLMTWNVENFFQPEPAQQADFDAKVASLADVITTAQPDAVALQEIGDEASFEALRTRLGADWTGVLSTHFESPHTIRVGWLSRRPLTDVQEVVDLPAQLAPVKVE